MASFTYADTTYFEPIEQLFIQRRGAGLMISSHDWNLIADWQKKGIPEFIVMRVISDVFDKREKHERVINSLSYLDKAVHSAFEDWRGMQVGSCEMIEVEIEPEDYICGICNQPYCLKLHKSEIADML